MRYGGLSYEISERVTISGKAGGIWGEIKLHMLTNRSHARYLPDPHQQHNGLTLICPIKCGILLPNALHLTI
jgi:hypothetical protein